MVVIDLEKIEIGFKSTPEYYHQESDGRKNNTVRKIDWEDSRFPTLLLMEQHNSFGFIKITLPGQCQGQDVTFKRRIQNVSVWNDLMIITWKHDGMIGEFEND